MLVSIALKRFLKHSLNICKEGAAQVALVVGVAHVVVWADSQVVVVEGAAQVAVEDAAQVEVV